MKRSGLILFAIALIVVAVGCGFSGTCCVWV